MAPDPGPVIALAGRRVDAPGAAVERLPLRRVPEVRERIRRFFRARRPAALVCSAACGADLLALEAAQELGVRSRIVLPFGPERFRETSVTDRPGEWGARYDALVEQAARRGDLVVLAAGEGERGYAAANRAILREALDLAGGLPGRAPPGVVAVIVWEGRPRKERDLTRQLADAARERGIPVEEIPTL